MAILEFIVKLVILIGFIHHFNSYKKADETPYHGIMAMIYMLILIL